MKKDALFILLIPLFVFIAVFGFGIYINYFTSLLLIFGVPSIYLSLKNKYKIKKVALFSLFVSIPTAMIFELLTIGDKAWSVPQSILPYRIFGLFPLEDYLWMFLTIYTILMFYEHFCTTSFQPRMSPRVKVMNWLLYTPTIFLIALHIFTGSFLEIPYAYLWICIPFFFIPITLFLWNYPHFIKNFFIVQMFFFYIHLIFELIGVHLNHWTYPGTHYLGWISFLGLRFPVEEFFFVILWGGLAPLVYYEFFTNKDLRKI